MRAWTDAKHVALQTFIVLDQAANVLVSLLSPWAWRGAWADETLSCRAYRAWRDGAVVGQFAMPFIDFLFKWQKLRPDAIGHCHNAYLNEKQKYNLPPEMRQ